MFVSILYSHICMYNIEMRYLYTVISIQYSFIISISCICELTPILYVIHLDVSIFSFKLFQLIFIFDICMV